MSCKGHFGYAKLNCQKERKTQAWVHKKSASDTDNFVKTIFFLNEANLSVLFYFEFNYVLFACSKHSRSYLGFESEQLVSFKLKWQQ